MLPLRDILHISKTKHKTCHILAKQKGKQAREFRNTTMLCFQATEVMTIIQNIQKKYESDIIN